MSPQSSLETLGARPRPVWATRLVDRQVCCLGPPRVSLVRDAGQVSRAPASMVCRAPRCDFGHIPPPPRTAAASRPVTVSAQSLLQRAVRAKGFPPADGPASGEGLAWASAVPVAACGAGLPSLSLLCWAWG